MTDDSVMQPAPVETCGTCGGLVSVAAKRMRCDPAISICNCTLVRSPEGDVLPEWKDGLPIGDMDTFRETLARTEKGDSYASGDIAISYSRLLRERESFRAALEAAEGARERLEAGLVDIQRHRDAWRRYAYTGEVRPKDFLDGNMVDAGETEIERLRARYTALRDAVVPVVDRMARMIEADFCDCEVDHICGKPDAEREVRVARAALATEEGDE